MERVDDVVVIQVSCGSLVGYVHGMGEREVPDGECLVLGIARHDPALELVVELGEAGGHLP